MARELKTLSRHLREALARAERKGGSRSIAVKNIERVIALRDKAKAHYRPLDYGINGDAPLILHGGN